MTFLLLASLRLFIPSAAAARNREIRPTRRAAAPQLGECFLPCGHAAPSRANGKVFQSENANAAVNTIPAMRTSANHCAPPVSRSPPDKTAKNAILKSARLEKPNGIFVLR